MGWLAPAPVRCLYSGLTGITACAQAREEAARVFAGILERATIGERIRSSLALLKQYESLFRLPPRIRDATKRRDHEQV